MRLSWSWSFLGWVFIFMLMNHMVWSQEEDLSMTKEESVMEERGAKNWTAVHLQADSASFMHEVIDWVDDVVEEKDWVDTAHASHSFYYQSKPEDLKTHGCGDMQLHRIGKALTTWLGDKQKTKKVKKAVMKLEWNPSKECMKENKITYMEGGGGAGFRVLCNETILLQASGGGGGSLMYSDLGKFSIGGSTIEFQLEGEKFKVSGGGIGKFTDVHVESSFLDGADKAIHHVKEAMRQCATEGTLVVRGAAGGGWSEKSELSVDGANREGFGFGFGFEYGTASSETPIEGEGDENDTPVEESSEEDTPEEEDVPEEEDFMEEDNEIEKEIEHANGPSEFNSVTAAQTFSAVSASCHGILNPMEMCFMRNSFGKEWFIPEISDESVVREGIPMVHEDVTSFGPLALGVGVIVGAAIFLAHTRQRRSGYAQLSDGENVLSA